MLPDELGANIRKIAKDEIASGRERGLQIVAYLHGRRIVDVCAGTAAGSPVTPSTRFMAYSVTKGVAATVIARTIDASRADYANAVSEHWPSFAAEGKEQVTIADALSHRAGLRARSVFPVRFFRIILWERRFHDAMAVGIDWIAACRPSWTPTTYARYHPTSWSWVAGGVYAHVSHQTDRRSGKMPLPHIREGVALLAQSLRVDVAEVQFGEAHAGSEAAPLVVPHAALLAEAAIAWRRAWGSPFGLRPLLRSLRVVCFPIVWVLLLLQIAVAWIECVGNWRESNPGCHVAGPPCVLPPR